jgi:ribosomal protein L32
MRHTKGHTGNRRSHHALKNRVVVRDAASGALRLPHRLDESTGTYRGKLIVAPKVKKAKEERDHSKLSEAEHARVHQIERAEAAKSKGSAGIIGKLTGSGKAKSRSGLGGGGS